MKYIKATMAVVGTAAALTLTLGGVADATTASTAQTSVVVHPLGCGGAAQVSCN